MTSYDTIGQGGYARSTNPGQPIQTTTNLQGTMCLTVRWWLSMCVENTDDANIYIIDFIGQPVFQVPYTEYINYMRVSWMKINSNPMTPTRVACNASRLLYQYTLFIRTCDRGSGLKMRSKCGCKKLTPRGQIVHLPVVVRVCAPQPNATRLSQQWCSSVSERFFDLID